MKSDRDRPRPIREFLRRMIVAPASLSFVWPVLLILGSYLAWDRWGADHVASKYASVQMEKIRLTEPPAYVRTNVIETVFQDTALGQLSLMDLQATAKIAAAFSTNAWIRRVVNVRKLPGGTIEVHVEYRQPVAMVHVFKPDPKISGDYFFPVDGSGVLLPTSEFAQSETLDYIHIEVPGVYPSGMVGSPFGDLRVEAAARLAGLLNSHRSEARIRSIGVHGDPRQELVPQLELTTVESQKIFWGSPPGREQLGEPTAEMKLRSLLSGQSIPNADLRMATLPNENR